MCHRVLNISLEYRIQHTNIKISSETKKISIYNESFLYFFFFLLKSDIENEVDDEDELFLWTT